jgi:adenylate cyclase
VRWWERRPLRTRIWLPYATLLIVVLLAALWVVAAAVGRWVEGSLTRQFEVTGNVFGALMVERAERLLGETSLLAADFALKRAIATYDPDTLVSVAENQRERLGVDLLWIADEKGRLLAAAGGEAAPGTAVGAIPPLDRVTASSHADVAVTEVGGALMQMVATPVFAPDPIGYLLAGAAIDDATARRLEATTGTRVSFLTPKRVLASSWPTDERGAALALEAGPLAEELSRAGTQAPAGTAVAEGERPTALVHVGGERFLSILIPVRAELSRPLYALIQASYDDALGPLGELPRWIAILGAATLAAALVVGGWIAGGIAAPLRSMAGAMSRVLDGDLTQRVTLRRGDEVGFLSRAFNEMVAGLAEREAIKATFGRFVSREIASAVLSGSLPLEGERREITVLFQDVRDFTAIAERLPPDVLVRVVNRLFTQMVAAVEGEGGVIGKFTGDGVMAMFGAPVLHDDDPERAVRAALGMVDRLPLMNESLRAEGLPPLSVGVGIHTGDVVAGRLGPDERSEYGVVGDAVNTAARIEALTREMDAMILVSAETASRVGGAFRLGRRAVLPVKGKSLPVEVVEVLGPDVAATIVSSGGLG